MIGKTISHYKILEKLGEGGMGVVYKAKDTKLTRTVALKFLAPQVIGGEEEKTRFMHEAQVAASLDHPNICSVYEIDEDKEQIFIAMAYIDGQSLREKVEAGPLKINTALDLATQIADGLQEAHEKGIVHRDIKGANIMVTPKGQVKIMDFGLARIGGQTKITKTGTTIGTAVYMSPEQVRGEKIDHRSDLWSLGVVLYEMITGQLPFKGEFAQAIMYSILHDSPELISGLRSNIPLELERIVAKCLEKDSADRYQTVSDLRADLRRLRRDIESGTAATVRMAPTVKRPWAKKVKPVVLASLGVFAAVIIALVLTWIFKSKKPAPAALEFTQFTSLGKLAVFPKWSPDGKWIVYASDEAGNMDIWKKPAQGGQAVQLTSSDYNEIQPDWSPDGRSIAFASGRNRGGIFLIHSDGGTPYQLTTFGANPAWSPKSKTLAFDWLGNIYLISSSGGEPQLLVDGTSATPYMSWSPDGKRMIFWNRTKGDIFVIKIDDGSSEPLHLIPPGEEVSGISWSKGGKLLVYCRGPFGGNKNLWKVSIDPDTGRPSNDAISLTSSITDDIHCALSPDGRSLAFTVNNLERHLWALSIDPNTSLTMGKAKQLTFRGKSNYYPALSPDGRMLAWTSHLAASGVLYLRDLDEDVETTVTRDWGSSTREIGASFSPDSKQISFASTVDGPYEIWRIPSFSSLPLKLTENEDTIRDASTAWSPDGETIAFYSNRSGNWDIWSTGAVRKGELKQMTIWESNENYPCWSPDGRSLAFTTNKEGNPDIWIMDADGKNPRPYVSHPAEEGWGAWSPNNRWFYFTSNRSGAFNVWVMPSESGEPSQVTDYYELSLCMPELALFTRFAVSSNLLVIPLESRRGDIYILNLSLPK